MGGVDYWQRSGELTRMVARAGTPDNSRAYERSVSDAEIFSAIRSLSPLDGDMGCPRNLEKRGTKRGIFESASEGPGAWPGIGPFIDVINGKLATQSRDHLVGGRGVKRATDTGSKHSVEPALRREESLGNLHFRPACDGEREDRTESADSQEQMPWMRSGTHERNPSYQ